MLVPIASILITLGVLEGVVRIALPWISPEETQVIQSHTRSLHAISNFKSRYIEHPYLVYQRANTILSATGVQIAQSYFTFDKPQNTLRVACIGGSTTEGAFPIPMMQSLQPSFPSSTIEVMDWGCSGWTIVEMTLNYVNRIRYFSPDVVVIHAGMNDIAPRLRENFRIDFSHFRKIFTEQSITLWDRIIARSNLFAFASFRFGYEPMSLLRIAMKGTVSNHQSMFQEHELERTLATYRSNVDALAKLILADGAVPVFAGMAYREMESLPPRLVSIVEQHNAVFEDTASRFNVPYLDLQPVFHWYPEWFRDHCHLRETGNRMKASMITEVISEHLIGAPRIWTSQISDTEGHALRVHIQANPHTVQSAEIWVQADEEEPARLGTISEMVAPVFEWNQETVVENEHLQGGPKPGQAYRFHVFPRHVNPDGKERHDPLATIHPELIGE